MSVASVITVAAGAFAAGHLGELTRIIPFDLADAVLDEFPGATERRVRLLPSRVGLYFVLGAPRGAVGPNGGGRPSSPRRRSGGVKLEAA
jgi:Insertion element 4 transposase N-terminal